MNWLKKVGAALVAVSMLLLGLAVPAQADSYDFEVTASAIANSTTLPSVITWTVTVDSVGDAMGAFGVQEGTVEFTTPSTISLTLSNDCDVSGHDVTCSWSVDDTMPQSFDVHGFVALSALGTISITPTITATSPRTDSNGTNDSVTVNCTAVTSILVTC